MKRFYPVLLIACLFFVGVLIASWRPTPETTTDVAEESEGSSGGISQFSVFFRTHEVVCLETTSNYSTNWEDPQRTATEDVKERIQQFLNKSNPIRSWEDAFTFSASCMDSPASRGHVIISIHHFVSGSKEFWYFDFVKNSFQHYISTPGATSFSMTVDGKEMKLLNFELSYMRRFEQTIYMKTHRYQITAWENQNRDRAYLYQFYDDDQICVLSGWLDRCPDIREIGQDVISLICQYGTGASTRNGFFYHFGTNTRSPEFSYILDATEEYVVLGEKDGIRIRSTFDEGYDSFFKLTQAPVPDSIQASFLEDERTVTVSYFLADTQQSYTEQFVINP